MIEVKGVVKRHGERLILDGASLSVARGEVACLVGASGSGKSTLLRCVNGLESFEAGQIQVGDIIQGPSREGDDREALLVQLRRKVGMVFQQFHLFPHLSVLENVCVGPVEVLGRPRAQAEAAALALLERVGLRDRARERPERLSGGEQQRVAIARALAVEPEAILFDEPTSALDPQRAAEVLGVIAELARAGQTMLVVTHALNFVHRVARTVHVIAGGKVVESGPPAEVLSAPKDPRTRAFLQGEEAGR